MAFNPTSFRPHPLFTHAHAQTIGGTLLPRPYGDVDGWRAAAEERVFALADGDRLRGLLHCPPGAERGPLVVVMHGLEGDSDSQYVWGLSLKAFRLGVASLRLNLRNCGGTEHWGRRLYNSDMIGDLRHVFDAMRAEGYTAVLPVGVSLTANMLLRLLGVMGTDAPDWLWGAVAMSPPIDLAHAGVSLGSGFNRLYNLYFLLQLREKVRRKAEIWPDDAALAEYATRARRARTLWEFDDWVTAPEGGFRDAQDYYARTSSAELLGHIRVPTLIIHAQDDPFIPYAMFERRAALIAGNPCLTTLYPERGGHVGFFESPFAPQAEPWMDAYWAENQAIAYLRALIGDRAAYTHQVIIT
ncbi:MAG TPA: alpha/beta fold hydrolase [Oscillatoriaceae cyanobacterium]